VKTKLENERLQLLDHWTRRLKKNPDLTSEKLPQVQRIWLASNGNEEAQSSLSSYLRQLHDKLGFKAKDSLNEGGLCAGAIFRTQAFIETKQRSGSKVEQSVHIEHTFPIKELKAEIIKGRFPNCTATLTWLLKHSVATAFHEDERRHLLGRTSNSDALNPSSAGYLKPFLRYEKLHWADGVVWNVFDDQKVVPQEFTFQDHLEIVMRLLEEAGATKAMLSAIRNSP
jgi:hypothetical protein